MAGTLSAQVQSLQGHTVLITFLPLVFFICATAPVHEVTGPHTHPRLLIHPNRSAAFWASEPFTSQPEG